jgi:hypothetical protein
MWILAPIAIFATALLLGGMVFFSAGVAPVIFRALPAETAASFARRLFPVYYLYILVCAGIGVVACLGFSPEDAALLGAVALAAFWLRQIIAPRLDALKAAGDQDGFRRDHRKSVLLNLLQMVLAAATLGRLIL